MIAVILVHINIVQIGIMTQSITIKLFIMHQSYLKKAK